MKTFELQSSDQKLAGKFSVWDTWANSAVLVLEFMVVIPIVFLHVKLDLNNTSFVQFPKLHPCFFHARYKQLDKQLTITAFNLLMYSRKTPFPGGTQPTSQQFFVPLAVHVVISWLRNK